MFTDEELAIFLDQKSCQMQDELAQSLKANRATVFKLLNEFLILQKLGKWVPYELKLRVPARHRGTVNSPRAASPLVWLGEVEERWEAHVHLQGFLPLYWGGTEQKALSPAWCSKLKLTTGENSSLWPR
ncbi:hypothetical protein TNCV_2101311 [Trichonephila clavipes]|nr:hypothetical protein TNCV_2101311 [Trichonephila clavipes]